MAKQYCPYCKQELPAAINERELHAKYDAQLRNHVNAALASQAEKHAAKRRQFEADTRTKAYAEADKQVDQKVKAALALQQRESLQERRKDQQTIADLQKQIKQSQKNKEAEINLAKAEGQKEAELKHVEERISLQDQISDLHRRLEKKSNEELREEGERDLLTLLKEAGHPDRYERIGHGKKVGTSLTP